MERSIAGGGEMELEQRVSEIVIEQLGVSRDDIDAESSFTDDLGADSLDLVELVMAMEEEFGVEIPEDDSEKLQTFGDVVAYLREKLEAD
jgi:acyl carrier protein